jgi:hypothetical protein
VSLIHRRQAGSEKSLFSSSLVQFHTDMAPEATRPGDRARLWGKEREAGSVGAGIPRRAHSLRAVSGSGALAGSPLPVSSTQQPSSSHLPAGRATGHLWRKGGPCSSPLQFTEHHNVLIVVSLLSLL